MTQDHNEKSLRALVGCDAQELVLKLPGLLSKPVATFTFRVYTAVSTVEEQPGNSKSADEDPRRRYSWGGIIDELMQTDDVERVIKRLLRHDLKSEAQSYREIAAEQLTRQNLQALLQELPKNHVLALCSRCHLLDGAIAHFPMLDLRCPPGRRNHQIIIKALQMLGQRRGVILASGRYLHYYGFDLLSESALMEFAARSLLLTPLADSRYIGHRMLAGTFALRISPSEQKPVVPRVVVVLGKYH